MEKENGWMDGWMNGEREWIDGSKKINKWKENSNRWMDGWMEKRNEWMDR